MVLTQILHGKASILHEIICAQLEAPHMMVVALFQTMNLIDRIETMPSQGIIHKVFEAWTQMTTIKHKEGSWSLTRDQVVQQQSPQY